MSPCANIVLVGLSGAGKTSCANILAELLDLSMLDTDQIIQAQTQKSIAAIFEERGEAYFRSLERQIIEDLLATDPPKQNTVLSVGGGLPTYLDNIDLLKRFGFTVFLNADPHTLSRRLAEDTTADRGLRPLLGTPEEIYKQQNTAVSCKGGTPVNNQIAQKISTDSKEIELQSVKVANRLSELLAGRLKYYQQAHLTIDTSGKSKEDVCFEIQTILINHPLNPPTL